MEAIADVEGQGIPGSTEGSEGFSKTPLAVSHADREKLSSWRAALNTNPHQQVLCQAD